MEGSSILARPLSFLVVALLWAIAMSEIGAGLRRGLFSPARLAVLAATVSAAAVLVVLAAGAAFSEKPVARDAREVTPAGCEVARGALVFGFGVEQASRVDDACARRGTNL